MSKVTTELFLLTELGSLPREQKVPVSDWQVLSKVPVHGGETTAKAKGR